MTHTEILNWLREDEPARLDQLWQQADCTRRESVGDAVHLRGLIEFSNVCRRQCGYCGLRADNTAIQRYRMTDAEIIDCVAQAVTFGYGTVVLQSGEDPKLDPTWLANLVRRIRRDMPLAVTLSVGERDESDYRLWRDAGADRFLLRFETSNRELFNRIHPSLSERGRPDGVGTGEAASGDHGSRNPRLAILRLLRSLGYQIGSGVMIGIPGQSFDDLARDIALFAELDLDMIGVGPFLPHPRTPLGNIDATPRCDNAQSVDNANQVPNSELMTYKVVALARLVCPQANIPSTTALATVNLAQGRELGLMRGANVVMPNLTPTKYRQLYEIYPAKACVRETAQRCHGCLRSRIESIGRHVATGRGDRIR